MTFLLLLLLKTLKHHSKLCFSRLLKQANIKSVHTKNSRNEKANYRPARILPNLSKSYGRWMYTQMNKYF